MLLGCCVCSEAFYLLLYMKHVGGKGGWVDTAVRMAGVGWGAKQVRSGLGCMLIVNAISQCSSPHPFQHFIKQVTNLAQILEAARSLDR